MTGMRCFAAILFVLAPQAVDAGDQPLRQEDTPTVKAPRLDGEYVHVYKPAGDVFPGPSVYGLKAGQYYEE